MTRHESVVSCPVPSAVRSRRHGYAIATLTPDRKVADIRLRAPDLRRFAHTPTPESTHDPRWSEPARGPQCPARNTPPAPPPAGPCRGEAVDTRVSEPPARGDGNCANLTVPSTHGNRASAPTPHFHAPGHAPGAGRHRSPSALSDGSPCGQDATLAAAGCPCRCARRRRSLPGTGARPVPAVALAWQRRPGRLSKPICRGRPAT